MTDADLRQAYKLRKEIKRLQENIEALRSQAEAITPILTGMPYVGGKADKVGNGAVRIVELQDRLCDKMEALGERLISINSWIDCIQDSAMRTLARERFLMGKTWQEVADSCGYATAESAKFSWWRYKEKLGL